MLYRVRGKWTGTIWEDRYCDECGALIDEKQRVRNKHINKVLDARDPDDALWRVEKLYNFDSIDDGEWADGPYIDELPVDQVLRRIGAPELFN